MEALEAVPSGEIPSEECHTPFLFLLILMALFALLDLFKGPLPFSFLPKSKLEGSDLTGSRPAGPQESQDSSITTGQLLQSPLAEDSLARAPFFPSVSKHRISPSTEVGMLKFKI